MKRTLSAALSMVLLLGGCALVPGAGAAKEPTEVVNGNSQFSPEGIKDMKESRQASFDVSERHLPIAAIGLPESSDGTLISTDPDKKIQVSIRTPTGVVSMSTDTIRVRTDRTRGMVDHIDFFYHFPIAKDADAEISRASSELGLRALDDFTGISADFKDGSGKEGWNPGFGNTTGTVFSVEAIQDRTYGSLLWIYSAQLSDDYYTPVISASIAETGNFELWQLPPID